MKLSGQNTAKKFTQILKKDYDDGFTLLELYNKMKAWHIDLILFHEFIKENKDNEKIMSEFNQTIFF
jgi:hypothetical protein